MERQEQQVCTVWFRLEDARGQSIGSEVSVAHCCLFDTIDTIKQRLIDAKALPLPEGVVRGDINLYGGEDKTMLPERDILGSQWRDKTPTVRRIGVTTTDPHHPLLDELLTMSIKAARANFLHDRLIVQPLRSVRPRTSFLKTKPESQQQQHQQQDKTKAVLPVVVLRPADNPTVSD